MKSADKAEPGWDAKIIHRIARDQFGSLREMFEHHGWAERGSHMLTSVQRHVVARYGSVDAFAAHFSRDEADSSIARIKIIGFDSAWTNNPKQPGAICAISLVAGSVEGFKPPVLATFEDALEFITAEKGSSDVTIVAIDQPMVVPNATGSRPVDKVAASLVSFVGGGVQPANRSKIGMFDDSAPIWHFKRELGAMEDPKASRTARNGHFIMEVFPALALLALEPSFNARQKAPKYNPVNRAKFKIEDWTAVLRSVANYGQVHGIAQLVQWAVELSGVARPRKADQDKLDAVICAMVGHRWIAGSTSDSVMIGDLTSGYIVTPANTDIRSRLAAKALQLGVPVDAAR